MSHHFDSHTGVALSKMACALRVHENDAIVSKAIKEAFPTLAVNEEMNGVLSLLLASLAYHHSFLEENLPENSRIRSTYPFLQPNFLRNLKKIVVCCYEWDEQNFDRLNAKGGSPHHYAMKERAEMRQESNEKFAEVNLKLDQQGKQLSEIKTSLEDLPKKTTAALEEFAEKNAISNGVVTQAQFVNFTNTITAALSNVQKSFIDALSDMKNPASIIKVSNDVVSDTPNTDNDEIEVYETSVIKPVKTWGGKLRRLRKGFTYPNVGLKEALAVWYYGGYYLESCLSLDELRSGERVRYPPLRTITCHDLERCNHMHKAKWSKVLGAVTSFTPNIPEYPSATQLAEIMKAGKHAVMATSLKYDVDQSSNSIMTMYNYFKRNTVSTNVTSNSMNATIVKKRSRNSSGSGKIKRKKSSVSSSSNLRRKSLPRAAKNKLAQIQVFLDERAHQESQQRVI
jgi:hypothetical protein